MIISFLSYLNLQIVSTCVIVFVAFLSTTNTMQIIIIILYTILLVLYQISNIVLTLFCLFLVLSNRNTTHSHVFKVKRNSAGQTNQSILQNLNDIMYGRPFPCTSEIKSISIIEVKIELILKYESGLFYLYQLLLSQLSNKVYTDKVLRILQNQAGLSVVHKRELKQQLYQLHNLEFKLDQIIRLLELE